MPQRRKDSAMKKEATPSEIIQTTPISLSPADMKFQQELVWCLEGLEAILKNKGKPHPQAKAALQAWKSLSDPKAPLVKKRQIMRMMFGDYRSKMEEEEKQQSLKLQQMKLAAAKAPSKSKYFRTACADGDSSRSFLFDFCLAHSDQELKEYKPSCDDRPSSSSDGPAPDGDSSSIAGDGLPDGSGNPSVAANCISSGTSHQYTRAEQSSTAYPPLTEDVSKKSHCFNFILEPAAT